MLVPETIVLSCVELRQVIELYGCLSPILQI